jgi:hypothetical protein
MIRSRRLFLVLGLTVCIMLAAGALSLLLLPREAALVVFDGKTTSGWLLVGDAEVNDGVLVLGGNQQTLAQIAHGFGSTWELQLEYSTENPAPVQFQWTHMEFLGSGAGSNSLARTSRKPGEWIEAVFQGKADPAGSGWVNSSKSRVIGEAAFMEQVHGGSASRPHTVFVAFAIPAGQKLYLRNVRATTEVEPFWPWLLIAAAVSLGALLAIALAIQVLMYKVSRLADDRHDGDPRTHRR